MIEFIEEQGKTIDNAIENALKLLSIDRDLVEVEILERPKSGFLGLGGTKARVKVSFDTKDTSYRPQRPAAEKVKFVPKKIDAPIVATNAQKSAPAPQRRPAPDRRPSAPRAEGSPSAAPARSAGSAPAPRAAAPASRAPQTGKPAPRQSSRPGFTEPVLSSELTDHGRAAQRFLDGFFQKMQMPETKITVLEGEKIVKVNMEGPDMGLLIGRRGETLDALQHITSLVLNKGEGNYVRVSVDTENYRAKREATLRTFARRMAVTAVKNKRSITLEVMSSQDRRIVHSALQDFRGVSTHSTGSEPNRRVVISIDTAASQQSRGGYSKTWTN